MERKNPYKINRNKETNRAIVVVATGEYNQFIPKLIESAIKYFNCHTYLFTDLPELHQNSPETTIIEIPHFGFPAMPLLRFEVLHRYSHLFQEAYIFLLDADTIFVKPVTQSVLSHRVGVMHRNIMRYRDEFNYENRIQSKAYVPQGHGEKYFACGFCGGKKSEFIKMCGIISANIRDDIRNGIRAIWGDESHLNRYFTDYRPTLVLPPSYMCPSTNPYFIPIIKHQAKTFKKVNKEDAEQLLEIDPKEYDQYFKMI